MNDVTKNIPYTICRMPVSVSVIEDQGWEFSCLNVSVWCRLKFRETELLVFFNWFAFLLLGFTHCSVYSSVQFGNTI
jgi:hypothetical protein